MGSISSRTFLYSFESGKGKVYPKRNIESITKTDRLVRDELCEEVQCSLPDKNAETCDRLFVIQVPPKSLQQKDV